MACLLVLFLFEQSIGKQFNNISWDSIIGEPWAHSFDMVKDYEFKLF
jgi:hypothetical protein